MRGVWVAGVRSSPPHPSAAPTPSPQGEGRAAGAAAPTVGWLPRAIQPGLAAVRPCGGRSSASDTPRSMSGWWSQCSWGSPALRREEAAPFAIQPPMSIIAPSSVGCADTFPPGGRQGRRGGGPYGGVVTACHSTGVGGGEALRRAEQSPAPTDKVAACLQTTRPFSNPSPGTARRVVAPYADALRRSIHPRLLVGRGDGADSASDTPRRMSGWWSQCPWGKPALRRIVVTVYHSTGLGGG